MQKEGRLLVVPKKIFQSKRAWLALLFLVIWIFLIIRGFLTDRGIPSSTLPALPFSLQEISKQVGIDIVHKGFNFEGTPLAHVGAEMGSLGAGVTVVDINNDGWADIFFPSVLPGEKNYLFVNDGKGNFKDRAQDYGLDKFSYGISRAIFFDCDNDGRSELFLTTTDTPKLLKGDRSGKFSHLPFQGEYFWAPAVNVLDYDRDGNLDLIFAGAGATLSGLFPNSLVNADNGGPIEFYRNLGRCSFEKKPFSQAVTNKKYFINSIGVGDLRNSGAQDVWMGTTMGINRAFVQGQEIYSALSASEMDRSTSTSGMNSEVGYLDNLDIPSVLVTHIFKSSYFIGGNNLWRFNGEKFKNIAFDRKVNNCGWAWGGKFIDLDNDTNLDMAIANGHVSNGKAPDYVYYMTLMGASASPFISDHKKWPDMRNYSFSGFQRDCLYYNDNGQLKNIAPQANFDPDTLDGRAMAVLDFDNDGVQDIFVANQKGRPYLYRVLPTSSKHWIGFDLRGTKSNREAIGAKIVLHLKDGRKLTREKRPANGFSAQSDWRIHFGLGASEIDFVSIQWPSGLREKLNGKVEVDKYNRVIEGTSEKI